jgi:hypothetical protein
MPWNFTSFFQELLPGNYSWLLGPLRKITPIGVGDRVHQAVDNSDRGAGPTSAQLPVFSCRRPAGPRLVRYARFSMRFVLFPEPVARFMTGAYVLGGVLFMRAAQPIQDT